MFSCLVFFHRQLHQIISMTMINIRCADFFTKTAFFILNDLVQTSYFHCCFSTTEGKLMKFVRDFVTFALAL
jgi:hypothetical protein